MHKIDFSSRRVINKYQGYCNSLKIWGYCLFLGLITACSTSKLPVISKANRGPVNYTIIYLIHGDANYLYHDQDGQPRKADLKVLSEAKWVAEHAKNGEVFIYHLKPETKIFYLFPRKDRRFLYYRNGKLVFEKNYSPRSNDKAFVTETKLYHHFHQPVTNNKKVLLYFGHEVPLKTGTHYFRSRPEALFSTALFAEGISKFIKSGSDKFDLVVLSTCDNGTPLMVQALSPFAWFVLASPFNLHLSHIDTKELHLLDEQGTLKTEKLAAKIGQSTYDRLSGFLQTVISLSLYNTDNLKTWLPEEATRYKSYLERKVDMVPSIENMDCSNLPFFTPNKTKRGVKVWYKPPRFGRDAGNNYFSGWGCKQ